MRVLLSLCLLTLAFFLCCCGGSGTAENVSPISSSGLSKAPGLSSVVKTGSALSEPQSELELELVVLNANAPGIAALTGICLKYDPDENDPLTEAEALANFNAAPGTLPADIDVQWVDYAGTPQSILIDSFKGAAFDRDKRYWVSAIFRAPDQLTQSPVCAPQRFRTLIGYTFTTAPDPVMVQKDIWGTVYGPDGLPVTGALVSFFNSEEFLEADTTDADGVFEFDIQMINPHSTSAILPSSRGTVTGPTACYLTLTAPGETTAVETAYLEPEFIDYNVNFSLNEAPVAALAAAPTEGLAPLVVAFDASGSSDPDGLPLEYIWDFDGDGIVDAMGDSATAQHIYLEDGVYTAMVTVRDQAGAEDSATIEISVGEQEPPVPPYPIWEELQQLPRGKQFCKLLGYGTKVIACSGHGQGGSAPSRHFDVYDTETGTWTADGYPMIPVEHEGYDAIILGDKLYTLGGGWGPATADVYILDLIAGTWSQGPSMNTARCFSSSVVYNGKIYVFGGEGMTGTTGTYLTQCECFDPATGTWSYITPYPINRVPQNATISGDEVHIFGEVTGATKHAVHRIYNITNGTWTSESMPYVCQSYVWTPVGKHGSYFYMYFAPSNVTARYTIADGTWAYGTGRSPGLTAAVCGIMHNGRMYIFHGESWQGFFCAYAPLSDSFSP